MGLQNGDSLAKTLPDICATVRFKVGSLRSALLNNIVEWPHCGRVVEWPQLCIIKIAQRNHEALHALE